MDKIKIDYTIGDPEPEDTETRKEYVAKAAGFFKDIGTEKINYMINDLLKSLMNPDLSDEENKKIKLTINGLSLFLDWGEEMISEHVSNSLPEETKEESAF